MVSNKNKDAFLFSSVKQLDKSFYIREDVLQIAKELLGKIIFTNIDNIITAARIVETEAYEGATDKASHAYNNRRTKRTEVMFAKGGKAYVYLCYGLHHLFNVVTNRQDVPHAVLIRAAEPFTGVEHMLARTSKKILDNTITRGPGNVSKALGIHTLHSGVDLTGNKIMIADDGYVISKEDIILSSRIGVAYAEEDALLPYRFYVKGNKYVTSPPNPSPKERGFTAQ